MQRLASKSAFRRGNHEALPQTRAVPVPERGYRNKLQVAKPVTKIRARLKFFVGLHQSVRYEKKRSLSKPSKQQAFGKRHMQKVDKQAVKRNPGEKRENKRN
jgi:hypothetical protein